MNRLRTKVRIVEQVEDSVNKDLTRVALIPFAAAILLGAFLVFQVQPVISKCVLPWFGGTPAVWTTCMLFFQVLLFGGYLYAHFLTRLFAPKRQAIIHGILLVAAICVLPIQPSNGWKPTGLEGPIIHLLCLLSVHVGLPYFVLSSTGPLVQAWLSYRVCDKSVYRLYALSNIGSLAALLTYPFIVEPIMSVAAQSVTWSIAFVLFAGIQVWLLFGLAQTKINALPETDSVKTDTNAPSASVHVVWAGFAAFASMMLLAITNHVCQDIAVIPFLWVLPLSLYLLSFIICFDRPDWYRPKVYAAALIACLVGWKLIGSVSWIHSLPLEIGYYMSILFLVCMLSHGEVARLKPDPKYLTTYYAFLSGGGALGGVFVGLICPMIFSTFFELTAGLCLTWVLGIVVFFSSQTWKTSDAHEKPVSRFGWLAIVLVMITLTLGASSRSSKALINSRSFFGVLKVFETKAGTALAHGRTLHGIQLNEPNRNQPTTYYGFDSGVGRLLTSFEDQSVKVGVIGLGIGTLASYGREGDRYEFIEINPDCVDIAQTYFTCLSDSEAHIEVVLGDGRLVLERENREYDALILDAFSSDGIPAHLLTIEAMELFKKNLSKRGVIAAHVTNLHLDLAPVVHRLAREMGWHSREIHAKGKSEDALQDSQWILIAEDESIFQLPNLDVARVPDQRRVDSAPLWTDQYHDLFSVLKL